MVKTSTTRYLTASLISVMILLISASLSYAQTGTLMSDNDRALFDTVDFEQNLDAKIPLDLAFVNEQGQQVQLNEYFGQKPVIIVMAYYECPMLCTLVLNGLLETLQEMSFTAGEEFEVVTVSIDPGETPQLAQEKKDLYLDFYGRPEAETGWHFLTGTEANIKQLSDTIGFSYVYDAEQDEYAHPSGFVITTPTGKIARYFFGIEFPTTDLRLSLVEAGDGQIGNPIDQVLLMCYHYDPEIGQYSMTVMNVVRIAGTLTILGIGLPILVMVYRERRMKAAT